MNFVGPRPAMPSQTELNVKREKLGIHKLKPGITGWAQVNGRNAISWEQKFNFDVEYVDKQSFALDLNLLRQHHQNKFRKQNRLNQKLHRNLDLK